MLLEDISRGTFRAKHDLPPQVREAIESRLVCSAHRRREVEQILNTTEPAYSNLWPDLRLVATWTGGSCGIALAALKPLLPSGARITEMGYLASELRGTIIVEGTQNLGWPTIHENFFEFAERDAWDAGRKVFLTIDRVEKGRQYYVVVTTPAGLYRYFMNDIVTIADSFRATPTIQFLQKGKGVTNITGEKLYESQVIQAVRAAGDQLGCPSVFFMMLAVPARGVYRLVYEWPSGLSLLKQELSARIDRELGDSNIEYAHKRASGRLAQLELLPVQSGTGEAYKKQCIQRGQREAQFKTIALQYEEECPFHFEEFRLRS